MRRRPIAGRLVSIALTLAMLPGIAAAAPKAGPELLRACPGGKLYQLGSHRVLLLSGTPHQMGLAHGRLLREEAKANATAVLTFVGAADIVRTRKLLAGTIHKAYARLEPFIPRRYQEEMRGLAEGAGVSVRRVQLTNVFPALFHCTGFALLGKATQGGRLLHGRILDYVTMLGLQGRAVTIIARPKGYNAFVNVSYAGFIGSVTGMNDKQIAIGEMGGGGEGKWDGVPMPLLVRKALEEAATLEQAVDVFRKAPRTCEYYYVISDGKIPDARGLYCTPQKLETVKCGQKHPQLPDVVDDAVILSGPDRLRALARRVRAHYGRIDPAAAIRMMRRPVSMKGNLHNALFAPASLEMWVAHAASVLQPDYQACNQEYQYYNIRALLTLMPAAPAAASTTVPARPRAEGHTAASRPAPQRGRVPVTVFRPLAPAGDPALAKLLKPFDCKPAGFDWQMQRIGQTEDCQIHAVTFPSPYVSPFEANNTVHCEYYLAERGGAPPRGSGRALGAARRPGVIVLHVLGGGFRVARVVCKYLTTGGIHALLVKMPFYGPRRPPDMDHLRKMGDDPDILVAAMRQAVMDVRRAARWLSTRAEVDPNRIGVCGVSLGGFCTAVSAGVDGYFPRVAIVLGGGNLAKVLTHPSEPVKPLREAIARKGLTPQGLRDLVKPIEPLTYASRLRRSKVLMINARSDEVVPNDCAEALAEAGGAKIKWYPGTHYTVALFMPVALGRVVAHFSAEDWSVGGRSDQQPAARAKARR